MTSTRGATRNSSRAWDPLDTSAVKCPQKSSLSSKVYSTWDALDTLVLVFSKGLFEAICEGSPVFFLPPKDLSY